MATQIEIPFRPTNQIWRTYKHFPYKAWYAVGELVDNSTQSYFDHRTELDPALERVGTKFQVTIDFDAQKRILVVADNAMGMDLAELRRAVQLAAIPPVTTGRCEFGMGLKTACSWLGSKWSVRTKKLGSRLEYSFVIDIDAHAESDAQVLQVLEKMVQETESHYTIVTVENVRSDFQRRALNQVKKHLAEMYRCDINSGSVTLMWGTDILTPERVVPLQTTFEIEGADGSRTVQTREWKAAINFEVTIDAERGTTKPVRGWVCIVVPGGRAKAGFDLIRRGRIVVGRPNGYRPESIFGVDRNDLINQRLYGELHLDDFPVNHLKDDFLWDEWGEEFEEKLKASCVDYVKQAREYRPTKAGLTSVPPAVVQTTNDELAEALTDEELVEKIHLIESTGPVPGPTVQERLAEAEILRDQAIEPRIVELQGKTYRIYHPVNMRPEQAYVKYEAPDGKTIDIFINDNHPYVMRIQRSSTAAQEYRTYAYSCVQDAVAVHLLSGLGREVMPQTFLDYKDQILRVMKQ